VIKRSDVVPRPDVVSSPDGPGPVQELVFESIDRLVQTAAVALMERQWRTAAICCDFVGILDEHGSRDD
jgi:hypothetical protein